MSTNNTVAFSMRMTPKTFNRLTRESKKLNTSKKKIIELALDQLFKSNHLSLEIN